ncbi:MAG: TRAP transporter small permease [Spirochaetales bacterium]|nr:TRAP transporter small permease [Spirochaetales bacterium]
MKQRILAAFNLLHLGMVFLSYAMMIAMVLIIFVNVVLRYVFDSGIVWSEEVALLLAVWFIFIAMSLGVKQDLHISISILPDNALPPWAHRMLEVAKNLVVLVVAAVMLVYGWKLTKVTMSSIMAATLWPAGLLYAVLPPTAFMIIYDALMAICGVDTRHRALDEFLSGKGSLKDVLGGSRG